MNDDLLNILNADPKQEEAKRCAWLISHLKQQIKECEDKGLEKSKRFFEKEFQKAIEWKGKLNKEGISVNKQS